MNTCSSVTINPNYIITGRFSAPRIEFRSQYPRMLRNNIDKKEFDEILQTIGTFVNAEFTKLFETQRQNYVSNIPCFFLPMVHLFKMNSLRMKFQEEYLEFERVVDDYIYKLNCDLLLEEKGVEVLTSWQETRGGIRREIRLVFNLI